MTFLPIPIGTDRPQRRFPWMNVLLIAANILIFAVSRPPAPIPHNPVPIEPLAHDFMKYLLDPRNPHLYQFISYQFLHEGPSHIIFNMLFLYVFGNNLNEKLGHVGYLAFYLTGGILAGCGHVLTSNNPTLGASGAISSVSGLFLVLLPRAHIRMFIWIIIYMDVWEIPSMFFILFKIGQDVFEQIAGGSHVAYMAHLAGTLAGFLIGLLLLLTHLVQRDHYDLLAIISRYKRQQDYKSLVSRGFDPFLPAPAAARPSEFKAPPPVDPRITSLRDEIARLLRLHDIPAAAQRYLELIAIDPGQVLAEPDQLDVANQLMADGNHAPAATAYENYLRIYPASHQVDKVALILAAVIYAHFLPNPTRAKELLRPLIPRLTDLSEKQMAESELAALESKYPATPPPPAAS